MTCSVNLVLSVVLNKYLAHGSVKVNPILFISSLDPTCQSGLVREAILLHQVGKTCIAACTSIANQNDVEIDDLTLLSFEEIKRQLDAIGRNY